MSKSEELRQLADKFSEGWHKGIKIDAMDVMLLSDAASELESLNATLIQTQQPATPESVKAERDQLRCAQAEAVMPLIGPLLDAWENADREVISQEPELSRQLKAINNAMEGAQPATGEPLIVKGAMTGMVDAQVRDLWPTKKEPATTEPVEDGLPLIVAGAIFDFAGFLTTRAEVIEVGSTANAGPVADLVKEWAELRGLSLADAAVLSWQLHITSASLPAPQQPDN